MAKHVQLYRLPTGAEIESYAGPEGELVVELTNFKLRVQDGVTPGGYPLALLSDVTGLEAAAAAALAAHELDTSTHGVGEIVGRTETQALSGKTYNGLTINTTTGALVITNGKTLTAQNSINMVGVDGAVLTFQGTDTYVGRTTTDTLQNKSISGSSNTLTNIGNSSLTNSAITIAGSATSLGGSITASTILDSISSTRGAHLYRGASGWAGLSPGTSGLPLVSAGAGADPAYGQIAISSAISGLGTGIATALGVNVGSAGAPVLFNGAGGTPSSIVLTNASGTASININGTVGATTPNTGAFTTGTFSDVITGSKSTNGGFTNLFTNANTGTGAYTALTLRNSASHDLALEMFGGSYTTSGIFRQDGALLYTQGAGGMTVDAATSSGAIYFALNDAEVARFAPTVDTTAYLFGIGGTPVKISSNIATVQVYGASGGGGIRFGRDSTKECAIYHNGTNILFDSYTPSLGTYLTIVGSSGAATFVSTISSGAITSSGAVTGTSLIPTSSSVPTNGMYLIGVGNVGFSAGSTAVFDFTAGRIQYISTTAIDNAIAYFGSTGTSASNPTIQFNACNSTAWNAANAAMFVGHRTSTGRSINASGTVNASGADHAEYEIKSALCATVAKGQIIGFDSEGKITDRWADAVAFGIKSTDPSYVSGDNWANAEALGVEAPRQPTDEGSVDFLLRLFRYELEKADFDEKLEAARQQVDRVAYNGKVPCNVTGANAGDYIIAVQDGDGIGGKVVTEPNFQEYIKAVGRVRKILDDGRALVAVICH